MSGASKTRVTVQTQDGLRELFSIEERSSGLYIFCRSSINHEDPVLGDVELLGERFTVHPSDRSTGTTIKRHTSLSDGRYFTSASFVEGPKDQLLAPIWCQYAPRLNLERYISTPKIRDRVIHLAAYNDSRSTLIYNVLVCAKAIQEPYYTDRAGNCTRIKFSRFDILVYYIFIAISAMPWNDFIVFATSPEQATAFPTTPEQGGRAPYGNLETQKHLDACSLKLMRKHWNRHLSHIAETTDPELVKSLHQGASLALATPIEDLEQSNDQLPLAFSTMLPSVEGTDSVVVALKGKAVGKIYFI